MIVRHSAIISVVIVNYFSEDRLAECLASLETEPTPVEAVIVDNGSEDRARDDLLRHHPNARWHRMAGNSGFSVACNAGVRISTAPLLLFLNPDAAVFRGTLSTLVTALNSQAFEQTILGCSILNSDRTMQLSCRSFPSWKTFFASRFSLLTRLSPRNSWSADYLLSDFDHRSSRPVGWVSGSAMAMRRTTFDRIGGFDEGFFLYFEDVDICRRAAEAGVPTWYYPAARVRHLIGGSSWHSPYRALAYRHQSMWKYYRRYHRNPLMDPLAAVAVALRFFFVIAVNGAKSLAERTGAVRSKATPAAEAEAE